MEERGEGKEYYLNKYTNVNNIPYSNLNYK